MPFAPRRRRSADDLPPEQQWTDRVPTHRMPRPAADDARVPPYGDPWAAPPPSDPWTPPPPRSQPWPPAPPSEPWAPPPPERRRPDTRRRRGGVPPQDEPQGRKRRQLRRRIGRFLVVAFLVHALVLLSLRWIDPPTTAFMLASDQGAIQQSVPVEHVSRNFLAAVIAHDYFAAPRATFIVAELYRHVLPVATDSGSRLAIVTLEIVRIREEDAVLV